MRDQELLVAAKKPYSTLISSIDTTQRKRGLDCAISGLVATVNFLGDMKVLGIIESVYSG